MDPARLARCQLIIDVHFNDRERHSAAKEPPNGRHRGGRSFFSDCSESVSSSGSSSEASGCPDFLASSRSRAWAVRATRVELLGIAVDASEATGPGAAPGAAVRSGQEPSIVAMLRAGWTSGAGIARGWAVFVSAGHFRGLITGGRIPPKRGLRESRLSQTAPAIAPPSVGAW